MKRKYYLRGLGIGILITALVFSFAGPSEMTEEEIIKRAEALGYVKMEDATPSIGLKELLENSTPAPTKATEETMTPIPTEEPTIVPEATEIPAPTPIEVVTTSTPVPTETPAPTSTPIPTITLVPTTEPTTAPMVEIVTAAITVERGNSAIMVCEKIEAAGILKNGNELLNYLIKNNLVDYINVGTYTMSSDMTLEEIAKQLTGR